MLFKNPSHHVCFFVAAWLLLVSLQPASAVGPSPVLLKDSVKELQSWTQAGPPDPHQPWITRTTLKSDEVAAPMDFEVALKMRNFPELEARIARGERISPQEMAARYDPLPSDIKAATDWLTGRGFTITRHDANPLAVFARGTVNQIQQAMGVSFARVSLEGKTYTSATTAPTLPANLSAAVLGVNGLQPHIRPHKHLIVKPNSLTGTNAPYLPSQIAKADSASALYTSGITGAGQSIAIIIDTFPAQSDLTSFWHTYGVNQSLSNITFIQVVSGTLPTTSEEETLDTEWSSSIAPGATVRVYATVSLDSTNLDQGYEQVFTDATTHPQLGIHQMSMSYGGGETDTTQSQVDTDDQYFAALAGVGVTVFASSGDGGSTPGTASAGDETGPLQVESPASDPYVTGVGGTSLTLNSNGSEKREVVWNNGTGATGGGTSIYFSRPSWQTGTGVPGGTMRTVPDVACPADPNTGAVLYYDGGQTIVGGTSWSSPTWAGYCALINQARANAGLPSIGLLGPNIYPLILTANFRDITVGNNATAKSGGLYSAGAGYDETTGIGVPLMQALTATMVGTVTQPQVQISAAFQDIVPGQNATISITSTGSPVSYQWQRMPIGTSTWSNLTTDGTYSGVATSSLTINATTTAMSGDQFQCLTTYAGPSTVTSPSSSLVVDTPLTVINIAGTVGTPGNVNANTGSAAEFAYPSGIAIDSSGNLYIADYNNNCIREITPAGVVSTPYGSTSGAYGNTDGTGNNALFYKPNALVTDSANNLYVADTGNNCIRQITASTGAVSTLATGFNAPSGIAIDSSGNLYVADTNNDVIKKVSSTGSVSLLAGSAENAGYVNATGSSARFNAPASVALDSAGNVYVADLNNDVVRMITPAGVVSLFAGQPQKAGYIDGISTLAAFNAPSGVAVDGSNNVYVADSLVPPIGSYAGGNSLLRRITTAGVVSTIAGQAGVTGSASGTGTAAQFYSLQSVAFNSAGEAFLADTYNQLVRAAGVTPTIITAPVAQVITVGQPVTFSAAASGAAPLTYQWLENNTTIPGATGAAYSIPSVAAGNAGNYSVTVTNAFGNVTSSTAALIPVNSQPVAQTVNAGDPVTFSVSVAGVGSFSYQWLLNGTAIDGATSSSYSIPSASSSDAGSYSVVISDANGIGTTVPVNLTVAPPTGTDTPTLPPLALVILAALLFFVAIRRKQFVS